MQEKCRHCILQEIVHRVEQEKERNLIAYKRKFEEYAANVGLIRKVYKDLTIMNFDTLNVKSGKEIFMDIVEYGN